MCGRFDQHTLPYRYAGYLDALLKAGADDPPPRYNVAPRTRAWVARQTRDGGRELVALWWGLLPFWAEDPQKAVRPINARSEEVRSKPMFRKLISTRRCLIPVDGFYEWRTTVAGRLPHYVRLADDSPMLLAGLWDRWRHGKAAPIESFTILTARANEVVAPLHDRMPVIIAAADAPIWLERGEAEAVEAMLKPYPAERIAAHPVSRRVNAARNEGADLIAPLPERA